MSSEARIPLVVVLGGTGNAGRAVLAECLARCVRVRAVSRRPPAADDSMPGVEYVAADIVTGIGLVAALTGADAIVDATDGISKAGRRTLMDGPRVVAAAARVARVRRLVLLSIINVDRGSYGYYRAKAAQEQAYRATSLDVTIVRATQFHDLVGMLFGLAPFGWTTRLVGTRFQPIAVRDVAARLVDEALVPSGRQRLHTIAGPEVLTARTIASLRRSANGGRGPIIPLRIPGPLVGFFRSGLNLAPEEAGGTLTFAEWLTGDVGGPAYSDPVTTTTTATWASTLAVFDLETTGIDVETTRIVTATVAVLDADGTVVGRTDWLVDPGIIIPDGAAEIHGITTEYARIHGRVAADAIAEIVAAVRGHLADGIPLVAYNASYDLSVLNREAVRYGIPPLVAPSPVIDPLIIDKAVDTYRKGKRTLTAAAEHYGVVLDNAHDAGADAIAAGHVAQAIARRYPHALALTAAELHDRQVDWCQAQAESFQSYMRRTNDPEFTTSGVWPVR
ncbi:MAG: NAD(P)H-binding protein [Leifsonia sp.]